MADETMAASPAKRPSTRWRQPLEWLLGGFAGTFGNGLILRAVAPAVFGLHPNPADLARTILHLDTQPAAMAVHIFSGFVLFPLVFVLVARPLSQHIAPGLPWWLVGPGFGIALGLVALALLLASTPAATDVMAMVIPTLLGHVLYGLGLAGVLHYRRA